MKKILHSLVLNAVKQFDNTKKIQLPAFQIEHTKDAKNGDYACNIALISSKILNQSPREIAEKIVHYLSTSNLPELDLITHMEIAGPGFINFTLSDKARYWIISGIFARKSHFGTSTIGMRNGVPIKILLEFISSNPTGPLHVGHGRSAAFGSSLANLLRTAGYHVDCEYYINDAGRQMEILAVSVWIRYLCLLDTSIDADAYFPANAYRGDYVHTIASQLRDTYDSRFKCPISAVFNNLPPDEKDGGDKNSYIDAFIAQAKQLLSNGFDAIQSFSAKAIMDDMKNDLAEFGVKYESWFSEKSLFEQDADLPSALEQSIVDLKKSGYTEEKDGALWFQSTHFGDDKDRVVIRANGKPTYFASDIAYHWNKYARGYEKLINIFGDDHHGYIARLKAVIAALGKDPSALEILLVQFVILYRGSERVPMSTRSGSFITLRQLREEVGNDAARFFYIQRKADQHMNFDLELAKSHSNDNPVYYVQYAHARICSVLKQMHEKKQHFDQAMGLNALTLLTSNIELQLIKTLSLYPNLIETAALAYEPHQITQYLRDLATNFHTYYNDTTFLVDEAQLRNARLCLIMATQQVLQNGLAILGVSTPESM